MRISLDAVESLPDTSMPKIGEVAGAAVFVFPNDHPPPHVHLRFQGSAIRLRITDAEAMDDTDRFPPRVLRDALVWWLRHRDTAASANASRPAARWMSAADFAGWMKEMGLSFAAAADLLDTSPRMLKYYAAGTHEIPKTVWLACMHLAAGKSRGAA